MSSSIKGDISGFINQIKENNIECIDFIWADIQGAERDMIRGAGSTLGMTKYLYTEYGEMASYPEAMSREETVELLEKYDFEVIQKYSSSSKNKIGNLLFKNRKL